MNIFVLDTNPVIAASMHCDQHLHKMILESAQIMSTAVRTLMPHTDWHLCSHVYKPTHNNHPCTLWAAQSWDHMIWISNLAHELQRQREVNSHDIHISLQVIDFITSYCARHTKPPAEFVFAGPMKYYIRPDLTIPQKYQAYYRDKHQAWVDKGRGMTYKNRPIPEFMRDIVR